MRFALFFNIQIDIILRFNAFSCGVGGIYGILLKKKEREKRKTGKRKAKKKPSKHKEEVMREELSLIEDRLS